jgi:hypothetical protein
MNKTPTLFGNLVAASLLLFGGLCTLGAACVPGGIIFGSQQMWIGFFILALLYVVTSVVLIYFRIVGKIKSCLSFPFIILLAGIVAFALELFIYLLKAAKRVRTPCSTEPPAYWISSVVVVAGVLLSIFSLIAIVLSVNSKGMTYWSDREGLWNVLMVAGFISTLAGAVCLNGDLHLTKGR